MYPYNTIFCFDGYIIGARELPLLSMFERINAPIIIRNYNKQKEEMKRTCPIFLKFKKRVDKNI
jgi:hypothetical protein